MFFKDFERFINEDYGTTQFGYGNPAFQIKLLGLAARDDTQPQAVKPSVVYPDKISPGDVIEVFDLKKEKTFTGRFVSGKTDDNGNYLEIVILDENGNKKRTLKSGHVIEKDK